MQKILIHICNHTEYQSFIKTFYENESDDIQLMSANVHGNLLEIYYQTKPEFVILPVNEYTQEFHDFISEYHKNTKIVLFLNGNVDNKDIFKFWNDHNISVIGKSIYFTEHNDTALWIRYDSLYDNTIYNRMNNSTRNDKVAVILSSDDAKNNSLLGSLLYPMSSEKLVLFNSGTYKHPQNVGILNPADTRVILNTYKSLVDIDDNFRLEAQVCGITNISTDGNLLSNIQENITKTIIENADQLSYNNFFKEIFSPKIIRKI
jgi:hypothetical protein